MCSGDFFGAFPEQFKWGSATGILCKPITCISVDEPEIIWFNWETLEPARLLCNSKDFFINIVSWNWRTRIVTIERRYIGR